MENSNIVGTASKREWLADVPLETMKRKHFQCSPGAELQIRSPRIKH